MATTLVLTELDALRTIRVTPDSRHVITGSRDGSCRIYNAQTGAKVHQIAQHQGDVYGMAVSSDGYVIRFCLYFEEYPQRPLLNEIERDKKN